jgi:UDP-N-acetylglucosamine--N-acetylmuramyl-(pentapeptide) pyrophosphoryl-undecaprenol N-acetylglucosamine transferase
VTAPAGAVRVVFAGGGTGGHVYPALAVARSLAGLGEPVEILFLGTRHGLEAREVPRAGYALRTLPGRGARRKGPAGWIAAPVLLALAVLRAAWILLRWDPRVVVGTGGYASAAGGLAAVLVGRRLLLQEQNAAPGLTNRMLARFAAEIHVAYRSAAERLGRPGRVHVTGNPVRAELIPEGSPRDAGDRKRSGPPLLLVLGGSQGAAALNRAAVGLARRLGPRGRARLLILAGARHAEGVRRELAGVEGVRVEAFLEDMSRAYREADLALCRAGALTVAELALWGLPAVLVPYPHAADDHQRLNAEELVRAGGALLVADDRIESEESLGRIASLLEDAGRLEEMARAARGLARPSATEQVARAVLDLARGETSTEGGGAGASASA